VETQPRRSKFLVPFALATIAIILIVAAFEFSNPISSTAKSPTTSASDQVATAYADHLDAVQSMNITQITGGFTPNASVEFYSMGAGNYFTPNTAGKRTSLNGTGTHVIGELYQGTFLSDFIIPHIVGENQTVTVNGNTANVESSFELSGSNFDGTNLYAYVDSHATYVKTGGNWLISYELWNFTNIVSH